jgi:hypothetical protein
MLDEDVADVYGVSMKALHQAVKRNRDRFPKDFAFQLNASETMRLRSQFATSDRQRITRIHPWVFADHGALTAAFVLHTKQAIQMSVHIVRASIRLREMLVGDEGLAKLLDELELRVLHHEEETTSILRAIRGLATSPEPNSRRRIRIISGEKPREPP